MLGGKRRPCTFPAQQNSTFHLYFLISHHTQLKLFKVTYLLKKTACDEILFQFTLCIQLLKRKQ